MRVGVVPERGVERTRRRRQDVLLMERRHVGRGSRVVAEHEHGVGGFEHGGQGESLGPASLGSSCLCRWMGVTLTLGCHQRQGFLVPRWDGAGELLACSDRRWRGVGDVPFPRAAGGRSGGSDSVFLMCGGHALRRHFLPVVVIEGDGIDARSCRTRGGDGILVGAGRGPTCGREELGAILFHSNHDSASHQGPSFSVGGHDPIECKLPSTPIETDEGETKGDGGGVGVDAEVEPAIAPRTLQYMEESNDIYLK